MYNKTQPDVISPQATTGHPDKGQARPAHNEVVCDGVSVPRGARVLRIKDVIARTGLSRSTLYMLMKTDQTFPKRISLSARTTGVIEDQLDAWIASRVAA